MIQFKPMTTQYEWDFFKERTNAIRCEDTQGIVAYSDKGIQAISVFDTWTANSCCTHMCIINPLVLRSNFLNEVATHLFHTCDREYIFGLVPSNNSKAIKFNLHIGWTEVARIPGGSGPNDDTIIMRMDKADCKWIEQPVKEEAA